jgi:S-formylglutathione hydrolase FrmB
VRFSRRRFLLGGGALGLAAVAGVGVTTPPGRRALHEAGLLEGDEHAPPALPAGLDPVPEIREGTLASKYMGRKVGITVVTPGRAAVAADPRPVVYCLHGRGGNHRFAVDTIRLQNFFFAGRLDATIVGVDGGASSYWHPRRDGTNPLLMLTEELLPEIEGRDLASRPKRAVLGWSMGGYGALLAGERFPDLFPVVVAASPALFLKASDATAGAFDGRLDFEAHDVFTETDRLDHGAVRIDVGADDPFEPAVRRFRSLLDPEPAGGVHPGFHDDRFWRGLAPAQTAFLRRHLVPED